MPAASTLECRLLSTCNCSYAIDDTGVFTPPAPYFAAAGFTAAPTPLVGGPGNINAVLVGTSGDGLVIAFRGTLVADVHDLRSLLDWAQNFEAAPVSITGMPGKVHSGFWPVESPSSSAKRGSNRNQIETRSDVDRRLGYAKNGVHSVEE